jgi:uncharacterized protein YicC (UPF0701 family)
MNSTVHGIETPQVLEQSAKQQILSSPTRTKMEVDVTITKDDEEETNLMYNEDELQELLKVNFNKCIDHMQILPKEASRFDIPLCKMVNMLLVRQTLASDIKRLEAEFLTPINQVRASSTSLFAMSVVRRW